MVAPLKIRRMAADVGGEMLAGWRLDPERVLPVLVARVDDRMEDSEGFSTQGEIETAAGRAADTAKHQCLLPASKSQAVRL